MVQQFVNEMNGKTLSIPNLEQEFKESLNHHIEPSALSTFQRILLTTNGSVTDILEAYLSEQIRVVKLSEKLVSLDHDIPSMQLKTGTEVIIRKVLLQGKISRKNVVYADSIIVPGRLEERFRDSLLNTKVPIGKLWFEERVETFKEVLESRREPAGELAHHFNMQPSDKLLSRTYCVMSNRKPVKMITEKFPENYFLGHL